MIGQSPGKLILCGEHAVVDGHPAIAAAIPRMTTVTLVERPGPTRISGDVRDDRLLPALLRILPSEGLEIQIQSELPIGCGLGSSAALAIAALRALAAWEGRVMEFSELHRRGFEVERAFHGTPSGVDHAVCALGGLIRYRRGKGGPARALDKQHRPQPLEGFELEPGWPRSAPFQVEGGGPGVFDGASHSTGRNGAKRPPSRRRGWPSTRIGGPEIAPLTIPAPLTLVLANTGRPRQTTAELVAQVRARGSAKELAAIGAIVQEVEAALVAGEGVGGLLNANHLLLQAIGVSTPDLDRACEVMRAAGASGAKLAGAGGGGIAIGLCTAEVAGGVEQAAREAGYPGFVVGVGRIP